MQKSKPILLRTISALLEKDPISSIERVDDNLRVTTVRGNVIDLSLLDDTVNDRIDSLIKTNSTIEKAYEYLSNSLNTVVEKQKDLEGIDHEEIVKRVIDGFAFDERIRDEVKSQLVDFGDGLSQRVSEEVIDGIVDNIRGDLDQLIKDLDITKKSINTFVDKNTLKTTIENELSGIMSALGDIEIPTDDDIYNIVKQYDEDKPELDPYVVDFTIREGKLFAIFSDGNERNLGYFMHQKLGGVAGERGQKGDPGKSAYQIAVENGFVGTEQEWLDSLQGEDGVSGTADIDVLQDDDVIVETISEIQFTGNIPEVSDSGNGRVTVNLNNYTDEPTGFSNKTDSVITFNDATREFTIAPTVDEFEVFISGKRYVFDQPLTSTIDNVTGLHFFYFDENGNLVNENTIPDVADILLRRATVAIVYWRVDEQRHIYFGEERHGITMDSATHVYNHLTFGSVYRYGLDLLNMTVDGDGDSDNHSQFGVQSGRISDEDINNDVIDGTPQVLQQYAEIPIFYRLGVGENWHRTDATDQPLILPGDVAGYNGTLPYLNSFDGTNWVLEESQNNRYILMHYFATNDIEHPIIGIAGNSSDSLSNVRTSALEEINTLTGLPFLEFLPIATVIFRTHAANGNISKANIVSMSNGDDYVDWRQTDINSTTSNSNQIPVFKYEVNLSGLTQTIPRTEHNFSRYVSYRASLISTGEEVSLEVRENNLEFVLDSNVDMTGLKFTINGF